MWAHPPSWVLGLMIMGKSILVIERQRLAGQLGPHAGGHPQLGPQSVSSKSYVESRLCSVQLAGEFDVFAKQV